MVFAEAGADQMSEDARGAAENTEWLTRGERGALLGIRLVFWFATVFGRWPARRFVWLVGTWYAWTDRAARSASREFLRRVYEREPTEREVRGHIRKFALVSLDRIFLLQQRDRAFRFNQNGNEHLRELVAEKRGAILLGAHLGSFEAMRCGAKDEHFPVHIVGHFENAKMINALLEKIDPEMAGRVIHTGRDPMNFALTVREQLDRGDLVAILGDRVGLNEKSVRVDFFGAPAAFPTGPFLLAAALKCPVYLTFGLFFEPNRYELFCEPFSERVELPRGQREEALQEVVQRFATRLEAYVRKAPDNWFNFFPFWAE